VSQRFYILRDREPVAVDLLEWARWFDDLKNRVVQLDEIRPGVRVSTVFLGIDHAFGRGRPLLFETMVFGGVHDEYQERYGTWDEAVSGHARAVAMARGGP